MRSQDLTTYSIVVPLFNEQQSATILIESVLAAVGTDLRFLELLLVDDGSQDATAALIEKASTADARIKLIRHGVNRGLGAAIRTGLAAAEGDVALYTDADLPFDFLLIPGLVSCSAPTSLVSGYRLNRGEGPRRWVLTKGYNLLIWLFFGLHMHDVNFACKIFPRRFLQSARLAAEGSFIDVEILLEAQRLGLRVVEHPLVYFPRETGVSTLSRPEVIFVILSELLTYLRSTLSTHEGWLAFARRSPVSKLVILSTTVATSLVFLLQPLPVDQAMEVVSLAVPAGTASLLFGRRFGLMASLLPVFGREFSLLWQQMPFLTVENYMFFVWALAAIVISQIFGGSWKLVRRSLKLTPSQ